LFRASFAAGIAAARRDRRGGGGGGGGHRRLRDLEVGSSFEDQVKQNKCYVKIGLTKIRVKQSHHFLDKPFID
jgi:hypothetical protein